MEVRRFQAGQKGIYPQITQISQIELRRADPSASLGMTSYPVFRGSREMSLRQGCATAYGSEVEHEFFAT